MKLEKVTSPENNVAELEITVPAEEFEKALDASYKKNVKNMSVPGFRRGKAPRKMIEKMYGESIFYEDAVNMLYPQAYEEAVKEAGIEPVDKADIEILSVNSDGFKFKAKVTVKPEITIKDYKGIKVERPSAEVTDADVEAEVDTYRHRQARLVTVEGRAAENGDTVVFDFEGFTDGTAFEGGKAENYSLMLGSGQFIPGFEEQMVGHNAGEEFSINVKFPEDYGAKELAGKDAEFKIKMHEIKQEELPEVNNDFVSDISEFDTVDEFKADLKKKIQERKDAQAQTAVNEKLSIAISEKVEGDIPECMYEQEVEKNLSDFEARLKSQGLSLEQYAQFTGTDVPSLRAMMRHTAETDVKLRLGLEKIAELEHVVIDENEINDEYAKIAEAYQMKPEDIKNDYITESITKDLAVQKAFEIVKNAAEYADEKPAKKTKAKNSDAKAKDSEAKDETKDEAKTEPKKKAKDESKKKEPKADADKAEAKKKEPKADKEGAKKTSSKSADSAKKSEKSEAKTSEKKTAKKTAAKKEESK